MAEEEKHSGLQDTATKAVRPVLIASENTLFDYSMFLEHLLAGLADESIPVALVCPPDCAVDSIISGAVEIIRYPTIKLPFVESYNRNRLLEQLAKFNPTVLHCLCESRAALTKQLSHWLDLPYILTVNSLPSLFNPPINWGAKYLAPSFIVKMPYGTRVFAPRFTWGSLMSRHCTKIIVPAKGIAADISKFYPRLAPLTEQINIGTFVEQDCVCFSQRGPRSGRGLVSMVTVHPFNNVTDFENLLGVARYLATNGYEFMLILIGAGRAESRLRKLLSAQDLLNCVTIVPRLNPWRSILAAGDIFIQPRPSVSFNPFMLEAMAVGCAVAACKGGVDDLIIDNQTAVVFNPNDEISIRVGLQQLLDRHELGRRLAANAQKYLRQNHSVSTMVSSILRVYREAIM